jgi:alpha-tubulin suppressor-like RCC1 family protein
MNFLPDDIIIYIILYLSIDDVRNFSIVNERFNRLIYNNNNFWRQKFILDFNYIPEEIILDWRYAYKNYGKVYSFGDNRSRQLGLGDTENRNVPTPILSQGDKIRAKSVSCGAKHSMIIDLDNNIYAFGRNEDGELGLGDNENRNVPTLIPNIKAKSVSCGVYDTLILDLNNDVYAFGKNYSGQLGLGDNVDRNVPTLIPNIKAKYISCGDHHTIIIDLNNNVYSFGYNEYGQLGLGDNENRNVPTLIQNLKAKSVSCGGFQTVILDLDNNIYVCGYNHYGQLGLGDYIDRNVPTLIKNIKAQSISSGDSHTIIIDLNNNVYGFGSNCGEQLGLDNVEAINVPTLILYRGIEIKTKSVFCGRWYTIITDLDDNIYVYGYNNYGQLGLGDNRTRRTLTLIPNIKANDISCGDHHTIIIAK